MQPRWRRLTWLWALSMALTVVLGACAAEARRDDPAPASTQAAVAGADQVAEGPATTVLDGPLTLKAFHKDREVQPGSDEAFEFLMVNSTPGDLPVEIWLERMDGVRWRTSLCVEKQCLLGDGSQASVTDPVVLPPYVELPFQAHVFVDGAASAGQSELLAVRVQPLVHGVEPQILTLSAVVAP